MSKLLSYEIERNPDKWKEKGELQQIKKPNRKRCSKSNKKILNNEISGNKAYVPARSQVRLT